MLRAAARAFGQLLDPSTWGVLAISAAAAALIVAGLWLGAGALVADTHLFESHWLDWLARAAVGVGAVFLGAALFGAVAAAIASLMVETVARAVERRYYPESPPARRSPVREQLRVALSFLLATLVVNTIALPVYLIWGANLPVFLGINGYLLGREYFELVALRRFDRPTVMLLRRVHAVRLLIAGIFIAILSFLPLANLLTPIVATAFMLHILQQLPGMREGLPADRVR